MSKISQDKTRIQTKFKYSFQDVLNEINQDYEQYKLQKLHELKVERDNILFQNPRRRKHENLISQELQYKIINIDSQIERLKKNTLYLEEQTLFFDTPIKKYEANRFSPKNAISQLNSISQLKTSYVKSNEDIDGVENVSCHICPVDYVQLKSSFKGSSIQNQELINPVDFVSKNMSTSPQIFNNTRVNLEKQLFQHDEYSLQNNFHIKQKYPTTSYLDEFIID